MAYNYEWPYTNPEQYNDDWLLTKMKQLAAEWEQMKVKFTTLEEYVKNYFANLNLQDEVNKKIDAMIADGSLSALLRQSTPYPPLFGKTLSIGGSFSANSVFNGYTLIGYFAAIASGNNIDLTDSSAGLLHPDNTSYYNILKAYIEAHPDRYRYVFIMLDKEDVYYQNNSLWVNALNNIFSLVYPYGAIPIVFYQPPHSRALTKEDVMIYNNFYAVNQSTFYRPQVPLPLFLCDGEIYSGNALSPSGSTVYTRLMFNACFPQFYSRIHSYDIIVDSDGITARAYNIAQNSNIILLYIEISIGGNVRNFNFPVHVKDLSAALVSETGMAIFKIENDIASVGGSEHATFMGTVAIEISNI